MQAVKITLTPKELNVLARAVKDKKDQVSRNIRTAGLTGNREKMHELAERLVEIETIEQRLVG